MSDMADVLRGHWSASTRTDRKPFVDKCDGCGAVIRSWGDETPTFGVDLLATHQAAALSAAGFGPVREARAEALEDAADAAEDPSPEDMETYFIDQADVGRWLRARAEKITEDT